MALRAAADAERQATVMCRILLLAAILVVSGCASEPSSEDSAPGGRFLPEGSAAVPDRKVQPTWPAKAGPASGFVWVEVRLDSLGTPLGAQVARTDLPQAYADSAVSAALRWTWKPAKDSRGVPVASTMTIPFSMEAP
jgi:TonB family protein